MIVVVGIGADGMAGLAPASRTELARATVIYGSRRQLDLLDDTVTTERRQWPSPMLDMVETLGDIVGDVHVVASGDPMLHGVGALLIRLFGADQVTVLPHVSCVTLACARLGWAVQDTTVISLMTAEPHTAVRRGGKAVILCRDGNDPAALARLLTDAGRGDSELTVLEQLGGPAERRRDAAAARVGGQSARRRRRPQRGGGALPARRSATVRAARRCVRPRWSDHETVDAGGHPRGACTTAGRAAVGRRRGIGQHRDRMVPQWIKVPRSGFRT